MVEPRRYMVGWLGRFNLGHERLWVIPVEMLGKLPHVHAESPGRSLDLPQ